MPPGDGDEASIREDDEPRVRCEACQSALDRAGAGDLSFLLLDDLRVPLLGCDDHLETFAEICALTTADTADVLGHRPAGGIRCPACRNARYSAAQPVISVRDGALVVPACPEHQAAIAGRFRSGLETHSRLTADAGATTDSPL